MAYGPFNAGGGVSGGADQNVFYGTCSTAAYTAAKTASISGFVLKNGVTVKIKFTNSNTASNPTLNVGGTGAKSIKRYGTTAPGNAVSTSWAAGAVVSLTYDGSYWQMNDNQNISTSDIGAVPTTRKINNKALSSDITLSASDVSAVPTTRKINNKALSSDITLSASDVGARASTWTPSAADVGAIPLAQKGVANGVAALGADGKVSSDQLPALGFTPRIVVTAPTGSTVTCVKGGTTLTATEVSGTWTFDVPDYGTWVISASKSGKSVSESVEVTEVKQYTLTLAYFTATINVTAPAGSSVTVKKGTSIISTHTGTGSAVAVTVHETGTYEATATNGADTATGSVSITEDGQTKAITLEFVPDDVDSASWDTISAVSAAGLGDTYWDAGDCKKIRLNGNIGEYLTLSNKDVYVFILGFNHNSAKGETQGILWGGFKTAKTNGTLFALFDSKYSPDASWATYTDGHKHFTMNHSSNTNVGGWKGCDFRYDILGACSSKGADATTATRSNPPSNTLAAALPADLRSALKLRTHYVDNTGNSSNVAANVTAVTDLISLMAEFEIFGARSYANQYEQNKQAQFAYFAAGNAHQWFKETAASTGLYVWEASPLYNDAASFCSVGDNGGASNVYAYRSLALAAAFLT